VSHISRTAYHHVVAIRVTNTTPSTTRIRTRFCFYLTCRLLRIAKFAMYYRIIKFNTIPVKVTSFPSYCTTSNIEVLLYSCMYRQSFVAIFRTYMSHKCHNIYSILTPWIRVLLDELTGFQRVKKFPAFYEPESSLPHSHLSATCPYPEPARSSPYPHICPFYVA
jgi:hypothetical protein